MYDRQKRVVYIAKGKYEYWLTDDGLLLLGAWARDGLTDEQIARKCGVSRSTIKDWRSRFPAISATLKKGKEIADIKVENALYKRAIGYEYTEIKDEYEFGALVKSTQVSKLMPPDVTAGIFWLKNRKGKDWRDRPLDNSDDAMAAIRLLVASNKEAARGALQQETGGGSTPGG
jgi:transcriptional regulator with XRE-family HTH domain